MTEGSRGHGWWPYLAPYGLFLVLVTVAERLPDGLFAAGLALKVLVPALVLAAFTWKGAYPELRIDRLGPGTLADCAFGLGIALVWVLPFALFPLERGAPFEPDRLGPEARPWVLGLRLLGFAVVTPFVEELFVRSFLHRYLQVWERPGHFLDVPVARYAGRAFVGTVLWFTLTHVSWEWIVALPVGVLLNGWLYLRRDLGACVVAHAVANAAIWAWVVLGPGGYWEFL